MKFCTHLLQGVTKVSTKFELQKIKDSIADQKIRSQTGVFSTFLKMTDLRALEESAKTA